MSHTAEVVYRRHKVARGEYQDMMPDQVWFLRQQLDRLTELFQEDFEMADEILDIGAGTCWFAAYMNEKYGKKVLSLDVSEDSMDLSGELYGFNGPQFVGEIQDLISLEQRFPLICCSALLHHLGNLNGFYANIARLLRPQGLFIAFNEPRSPHLLPLKYLHRIWFGRSTRSYGILDMPRTLPEYLDPLPSTVDAHVLIDSEKSRRNYEQELGEWAARLYSIFAERPILQFARMHLFPEALILTMRKL